MSESTSHTLYEFENGSSLNACFKDSDRNLIISWWIHTFSWTIDSFSIHFCSIRLPSFHQPKLSVQSECWSQLRALRLISSSVQPKTIHTSTPELWYSQKTTLLQRKPKNLILLNCVEKKIHQPTRLTTGLNTFMPQLGVVISTLFLWVSGSNFKMKIKYWGEESAPDCTKVSWSSNKTVGRVHITTIGDVNHTP